MTICQDFFFFAYVSIEHQDFIETIHIVIVNLGFLTETICPA